MKNLKIKTKLALIVAVTMLLSTAFFVISNIISYNIYLDKHLEQLSKETYDIKKKELMNYSDMANKVIASYYERTQNNKSDSLTKQMQKEALLAIKNMRYGKNGYFWINNMDNKMLMHPIKPKYNNKYFIDTPKVPFVELGTTKLKETKNSRDFIEYSFYTPATKKYSHKLSIVQKFEPWNWVVGTGVYTDYVEEKIEKEKLIALTEMETRITNIVITSTIILIILILLIMKLMERIIINPLSRFEEGLDQFFKYLDNGLVVVNKLTNQNKDEIGLMSQKTNMAIESAINTYKELVELRQQLELKVSTINQNTNESLEYGALIQRSILPDKNLLENTFSDNFILDIQNNIISSQFYIFEQIKPNEYLYVVVDCKQDGINGVFITMLINAIIKQAITQLKYEQNNDVSTAWILEYLNENIENTHDEFDCATVYYNKRNNTIKYSSTNLPFHYYQDNQFNIIQPDMQSLGINKEFKYTEHIIDIKEYLEFYISTHNYIEDFVDSSDFKSPFQTNANQFKDHLQDIDTDIVVSGFQIDNKPKIIVEYDGEFTQELANKYTESIEDKIANIGLMSNVSTNFIEQYQNILKYGKSKDISNNDVSPYGSITLQKNSDASYSIETINIVTISDKQKIEPKLLEIQSLDRDGIRKRYRELRKSGQNTHEKGGGIGFYEIAKRCFKIEYNFTQLNKDRYEFRFISFISSNKK